MTAGSVRTNAKEREKKERQARRAKKNQEIHGQRIKPPLPTRVIDGLIGDKQQNRKEKEEKRIEEQRAKPLPSIPAIDALIGDEEQTGKSREQRKKQGTGPQTQLPWTLRSPPTTHRYHTMSLFF